MPTLNLWSVQGTSLGVAFLRGLICWSDHALDWGLAKGQLSVITRMKCEHMVSGICMCVCEISHSAERSWGKKRRETGCRLSQNFRRSGALEQPLGAAEANSFPREATSACICMCVPMYPDVSAHVSTCIHACVYPCMRTKPNLVGRGAAARVGGAAAAFGLQCVFMVI